MITLKINNNVFFLKKNISILEACRLVGIHLPRFCYHEILSVVGNCRMCLVEIEKSPKPVVSCAMPVSNNLIINTNSPLIKKSRENILELLLLNHPLDCPICDQGGECDLQDQVRLDGLKSSRGFVFKRGVEDKNYGVFIKTIMTRCIHCTRCVRFSEEIAGILGFGTFNRGTFMEIGSYTTSFFNSEVSGNVIDLCPVGALTSKPYAFKTRSWELKVEETVDCTDNFGSNILVNYKDNEILRIQPKINKHINQTLITDRIRFSYDSLNSNRINKLIKKSKVLKINSDISLLFLSNSKELINDSKLIDLKNFNFELEVNLVDLENLNGLNQNKAFKKLFVSYLIKLKILSKNFLDCSEFLFFKKFKINLITPVYTTESVSSLTKYISQLKNVKLTVLINEKIDLNLGIQLLQLKFLKTNIQICSVSNLSNKKNNFLVSYLNNNNRYSLFLQNNNFKLCFLLSVDLKIESTLLNVKVRNRWQHNNLKIISFGRKTNNSLNYLYVNLAFKSIFQLLEGKNLNTFLLLKNYSPLVIMGDSFKNRCNFKTFQHTFLKYCPSGIFLNISGDLNTIGLEYLNFSELNQKIIDSTDIFIMLNLEDNIFIREFINKLTVKKEFLWFNTHMSIIPTNKALFVGSFPTFLESENFYINFDNIVQKTQNIFKTQHTFKVFDIFYFNKISKINSFNFLTTKESFFFFFKEKFIKNTNTVNSLLFFSLKLWTKNFFSFNSNYPLKSVLEDFFLKDNFTKNSKNLLLRSQEIRKNYLFFNK